MGIISNLFSESEFNEYRELQNILEADEEEEDNFDMPDDDQDITNGEEAGDDLPMDGEGEDNFDMPDDDQENPPQEEPDPQTEEVPQDNNQGTEPVQQEVPQEAPADDIPADDPAENNFDMPDDQEANTPDTGEEGTGDDMPMDGEGEDNFDLPDDAGEEGADTGDGTDATGGDDGMADTTNTGPDPDQDLKDAEASIFDNLSDEDKVAKINELKGLYEDLYNRIITLYDKVNQLPKEEDLIKVYNFVLSNLEDLKQFVYDYTSSTFDNKTYLENLVNYKKYLSTLNVINGILEEIRKGLYAADK